jgi:DNA polymerase-3 subunit beta
MELKLQKNLVLQELSILQGVIEHRTTIPILSCILTEIAAGKARMVATDLDMTIMTSCPATTEGEGRLALESKVFQDLVRNLPEDEFTITEHGDDVEITSGRFLSRMSLKDPSEYPTLPDVPPVGDYVLPLDLFQLMISRVAFAITKDDPKFQLNGALVKLVPGQIEIAATDGHRLAMVRAPGPEEPAPFEQQLFPRKLLAEIERFVGDEQVHLSAGDNHLGFQIGERTLISRIVELRFPQYERVVVRDHPIRARVERRELLASLRRVSLMAHEKARGVRFSFETSGELTLTSIGYDRGSAEETISITYQGNESVAINLNAAYMIDMLQVLECPLVELQLRDPGSQCVIVPVDDDPRLEEYIYVLMPIRT